MKRKENMYEPVVSFKEQTPEMLLGTENEIRCMKSIFFRRGQESDRVCKEYNSLGLNV